MPPIPSPADQAGRPGVAIMPDRFQTGTDTLVAHVPLTPVIPWEQAWTTRWATDAHLLPYRFVRAGQYVDRFPRANKGLLPAVRAGGGDIVVTLLVVDVDNVNHLPWTPPMLAAWRAALAGLRGPLAKWAVHYTTRGGSRLVYLLDEPVPAEQAEGRLAWLRGALRDAGLPGDPKCWGQCKSWNWCFRLPSVRRVTEGTPPGVYSTWEAGSFQLDMQDARLPVAETGWVEPTDKATAELLAKQVPDLSRPTDDTALDLLYEISRDSGRRLSATWYKEAKKILKGVECAEVIFGNRPIAEEGGRDDAIMRLVGQAVSALYRKTLGGQRLLTPERCYAMFLRAALELVPDGGTKDWTQKLWYAVRYCWSHQEAATATEAEEVQEKQQTLVEGQQSLLQSVIQGMRTWCRAAALQEDTPAAVQYASAHFIAMVAGNPALYVMGPDGLYDSMPVTAGQLIPRVRGLGLEPLIQTCRMGKDGGTVFLDPRDIVSRHGTLTKSVHGLAGFDGCRIKDVDGRSAVLEQGLFMRRTDIKAEYSDDCQEWLRRLFGLANYERGLKWIGHALAFDDRPTSALALIGASGAGKKMFVRGLAECINTRCTAGGASITGRFQEGLMHSPFVVVNEGTPTRNGAAREFADSFRELTGGEEIWIDQKNRPLTLVLVPYRVIITANTPRILSALTEGREYTSDDRDSLAERIFHVPVSDAATGWLARANGTSLRMTRGWIRGDGGEEGEATLARHFLWLYENRAEAMGARFLVEGNRTDEALTELRTEGAIVPFVSEAVLKMVEAHQACAEVAIVHGRVFVLAMGVLEWVRKNTATLGARITPRSIGGALRGLCVGEPQTMTIAGKESLGRKKWHELDLSLLMTVAERDGWPSKKLEQIVAGNRAEEERETRGGRRR